MNDIQDDNSFSEAKAITILSLPDEILDTLMSYTSYDEISRFRLVCRKFNSAAQRVLNQGFYKVEKYHAQCLRKVKEQLPRRESERRKHPLSVHCDILTSIETRLSLLGMTFMKYVELKFCCFIPGKVLDEIFKVLRLVSTVSVLPRAHDILLELRDISSMAMEHFDEKVAPAFRARTSSKPKLVVTPYGAFTGTTRCSSSTHSTSTSLLSSPSTLELVKLRVAMKQQNFKSLELKKENADIKHKLTDHRRKLQEFDGRLLEQNNILIQQNTRIAEQDQKKVEEERKFIEQERKILLQEKKIFEQDKKILELSRKVNELVKSPPNLANPASEFKNLLTPESMSESCDLNVSQGENNLLQPVIDSIAANHVTSKDNLKKNDKKVLINPSSQENEINKLCSTPYEGILTRRKRKQQIAFLTTGEPLLTDVNTPKGLKRCKTEKTQKSRQWRKS